MDNRPLNFGEFESKIDQILFVSATPGEYEADHEMLRAEQIIRPTGLLDPKVEVRPVEGRSMTWWAKSIRRLRQAIKF